MADDLLRFIGGIDPGLGRLPTVRAVITVNEPLRVQKMMQRTFVRVVSGARHGRLTTLKFLNDGRMACLGEETTLRGDGVGINPGFGQPPTRKSIIASVYRQKLALYRR